MSAATRPMTVLDRIPSVGDVLVNTYKAYREVTVRDVIYFDSGPYTDEYLFMRVGEGVSYWFRAEGRTCGRWHYISRADGGETTVEVEAEAANPTPVTESLFEKEDG